MNYLFSFLLVFTALILSSCTKPVVNPQMSHDTVKIDTSFMMNYDVNSLAVSSLFDSGRIAGSIEDLALNEVSGMALSQSTPDAIWVEEDSGNENKIYLINTSGKYVAGFRMGVDNRDWEDMSIAPGPVPGLNYIYLADIGDNKHINPTKYIYRFAEPALADKDEIISGIDKIIFQYPDGIKNAEAVMIDPLTNDIYIISKEDMAVVYVARYPQILNRVIKLTKLGVLPIPTVTAADISPDGSEILIKNYNKIFYWKKKDSASITQLLQQKPVCFAYVPEPKGESICWASNGSGYFTTSEIVGDEASKIFFYKRK